MRPLVLLLVVTLCAPVLLSPSGRSGLGGSLMRIRAHTTETLDAVAPWAARRAGRVELGHRSGDGIGDLVAREVPEGTALEVKALAARLAAQAGPRERVRARAAFRYVVAHVAYDLDADSDPDVVLRSGRAKCRGYAELLVALWRAMGLDAEVVTGWAREAGPGAGAHAWVAVHLVDGWYLADPTWASSLRAPTVGPSWALDEAWWLVPPARMAVTHQPNRRRWRLGA